jgi:hypothetical protein
VLGDADRPLRELFPDFPPCRLTTVLRDRSALITFGTGVS